jgi:hypothetical protein
MLHGMEQNKQHSQFQFFPPKKTCRQVSRGKNNICFRSAFLFSLDIGAYISAMSALVNIPFDQISNLWISFKL